ncbi:uncharacterized protein K489DRAFT_433658 [Dissoconium aciculare CBS 342.82]|uniref:Uncharacterized protein n=1 Tax=Dissoconium aciculare CBS 342.82 TaxID=1314786 RepID=A0A6J3LWT4_9PEZI|nr:uncharacterized protein K489DRAFT_433658 [Dissoconium aciculare CBS 342.82]KAF1820220.1 hypothetical protein K489DRAFT_433658 [Dissoconium aciculare CBS 342.82]
MTSTPAYSPPLDPAEQPILENVLAIRDHLSIMKQDRSTYVKSGDVVTWYFKLIEEVEQLNRVRENRRYEQNRLDTVLDDCFQLISLFFLTIGRNSEAPAIYSAVSTVKRILDHLKEAAHYSPKDLKGLSGQIELWQKSIDRAKEAHSDALLTLLQARIDVCKAQLKELNDALSTMDEPTMAQWDKLVSILRLLSACNCRSKYPEEEVKEYHEQLLEMQRELNAELDLHPGKTAEETYAERISTITLAMQAGQDGRTVVNGLLARCLLWVEIVEEKRGHIDERFQDTFDKLVKIRNALDQMNLTHAWSLRETDLYSYQRELDAIDASRVNGEFVDVEGKPADLHAQRTLLYLLRKSYAFIYQYIISSEPVSEALLPIYNQLLTLKKCLVEVQRSGGVDSPRELYPYSMKLTSIDNMRKDGKFTVGNEIPEGQGSVSALLAECFELAYELRNEADERAAAAEGGAES